MRQIVTFSIVIAALALALASCDTRNEKALEAKADAVRDSAEAKAAAQEMATDSVSHR
ncbi:hypothetical protein [Hymenobacter sediminis]|uniref:hypothetical protein n=1 Tax=Hymenobacter sediminis TaxID=2218621 RepID=UPI00138FB469|nr:hypothetical protein [Hymenobacter sediminis]